MELNNGSGSHMGAILNMQDLLHLQFYPNNFD